MAPPLLPDPDRLAAAAMMTVVNPGHLRCELCGVQVTWSGGVTVAGTTFGSESLAAYLHFAEHVCGPPARR